MKNHCAHRRWLKAIETANSLRLENYIFKGKVQEVSTTNS